MGASATLQHFPAVQALDTRNSKPQAALTSVRLVRLKVTAALTKTPARQP